MDEITWYWDGQSTVETGYYRRHLPVKHDGGEYYKDMSFNGALALLNNITIHSALLITITIFINIITEGAAVI